MSTTTQTPHRRLPAWATVAKREILVQLTDKAFWIGTLTTIALLIIALAFSWFMSDGDGSPSKIAVSDEAGAGVVAMAAASGQNVEALNVSPDDLQAAVHDDRADAALQHSDAGWEMFAKPATGFGGGIDLSDAVRTYQLEQNATALGVDATAVLADTTLTLTPLIADGASDPGIAVVIATMAFAILFLMSAMTYGMQIAQSVVTEKESRIVEILAATIPIRQLLIGKVVGNSIMALSQVILFVLVTLVGLSFTEYRPLIGMIAPVAGWFILFFLVGFASLACLWAAAGAMATRMQDLGQTTTPLTMIVMGVYMAGFLAQGTVATVLSYVPIVSTVMMPGRLLSGEASWVDALIALLVAIVFMGVAILLGERVYRRGLLQTGTVMTLRDAFRLKSA